MSPYAPSRGCRQSRVRDIPGNILHPRPVSLLTRGWGAGCPPGYGVPVHPGIRRLVVQEQLRRRGLKLSRSAWVNISGADSLVFGTNCRVARGSLLVTTDNRRGRGRIAMRDNVLVGEYSNIRATGCDISLGKDVLLAQFVSLIGANHAVDQDGIPTEEDDLDGPAGISVEDKCWLGVGCVLLPGVELGHGSIVGAGAVVTKSWPARSRLVGVPARTI